MPRKKAEKPKVIIAKVTNTYWDFPNAIYEVSLTDKKTFEALQTVYTDESDGGFKKGEELTLWMTASGRCKYIARKNKIITTKYCEDDLDIPTQQHFDKYQAKFNEQQDLKKRLSEIEKKIAVIQSIDTGNVSDMFEENEVRGAKQALAKYLQKNADITSSKIVKKIKVK